MLFIFLVFFLCFLFVLYPNSSAIEITSIQTLTKSWLPPGFYSFVLMVRHWHLSLFYVFCELWGTVVLSLLVWGFINDNIVFHEAKKMYPIFLLIFAGIIAGKTTQALTLEKRYFSLSSFQTAWEQSFALQLLIASLSCAVIIILFLKLNSLFSCKKSDELCKPSEQTTLNTGQKSNILYVLRLLVEQKILLYITILVFSYNVTYNLFEIIWIHQIKLMYVDSLSFNLYVGKITANLGIFATLASLVVISFGKSKLFSNWLAIACVAPTVCFITTLLFILSFYQVFNIFTINSTLFFASCQIVLGRVCKYTVFDETKESAFIPLPQNIKRKGKAFIDLFSFKFGQLISNFIIQVLIIMFLSASSIEPYLLGIIFTMNFIWYISVIRLWKVLQKMARSS